MAAVSAMLNADRVDAFCALRFVMSYHMVASVGTGVTGVQKPPTLRPLDAGARSHLSSADAAEMRLAWSHEVRLAVGAKSARLMTYQGVTDALASPYRINPRAKRLSGSRLPGEAPAKRNTIRKYRAASVYPQKNSVWNWEQALYRGGNLMFSGIRGLYRTGYLADYYGVLGRFFLRSAAGDEDPYWQMLPLWKIIVCMSAATDWYSIYEEPEAARLYCDNEMTSIRSDDYVHELFLSEAHSMDIPFRARIDAGLVARRLLSFSKDVNTAFEHAWRAWQRFQTPAHPRNPLRKTMDTIIAAARNRYQPYRERLDQTRLTLLLALEPYITDWPLSDFYNYFHPDLIRPAALEKPTLVLEIKPALTADDNESWN